jgi:hypothetical protein
VDDDARTCGGQGVGSNRSFPRQAQMISAFYQQIDQVSEQFSNFDR